jgi:predicted ATPase/DNA-binding winged helix-turn-helix (wHTH) protein
VEPENEQAWCGERRLTLTPRAFAVLRHLVDHRDRLITKDDLLTAVWRDTVVSDAALASCIRDLRRALRDSSIAPRYIETVHRRGFRFIGPIGAPRALSHQRARATRLTSEWHRASNPPRGLPMVVGREAELAGLHERFERARDRQPQMVFVTGEAGIGKTALVEAFLAELPAGDGLRVGRGQCVEQYGAGEAYLPVLEALGRLGRAPGGERVVDVLRQHAPTWLAQLPGLLADRDLDVVLRRAQGATRERMLRELVDALATLGIEAPLVLVLEDLHWSDSATVDLLAMLGRRREPVRLLVLGTYRPADVAERSHPLWDVTRELQVHGQCAELSLQFLGEAAVDAYLGERFPGHELPPEFASVLHRRTDGNPLFLVNTIDDLVARAQLCEVGGRWHLAVALTDIASETPATLWQMVEKQIGRLTPDERATLAVASVAGAEFSAAVAAVEGGDAQGGDERCEALAHRGQFLRAAGAAEWPDGTVAGRYAFIHTLYRDVLYATVPIGHRLKLHRRAAQRLEQGYGLRAGEIAGELAMHFEQGRDLERAVHYRTRAGENALRQHGYREAAGHAARAIELVARLPAATGRAEQELSLQVTLGAALTATEGYAAPDVERAYARARELCIDLGDPPELFPVLLGLGRFHHSRGEVEIARGIAARLLAIAETTRDAAARFAAEGALGIVAFYVGDFEAALAHVERGLALYDPERHSPNHATAFRAGQDPGVSCAIYAAWALQVLGYPARAAARMREALTLARSLAHPFTLAYACHFAAGFHLSRGEREAAQALEDEAHSHSTEQGFRLFLMSGAIHRGFLLSDEGRAEVGLAQMREGLAASRAIGIELRRPAFLALVAEACHRADCPDDAFAAVDEALASAAHTGQHYWDAELHRLRGEFAHVFGAADRAGASFRRAIEIARRQRAKLFELRAATALGRLLVDRGARGEARELLSEICDWFTEGFDTPDLKAAGSLLDSIELR